MLAQQPPPSLSFSLLSFSSCILYVIWSLFFASIHPPLLPTPPPMWSADVIAPPVAINSWKQTTLLHSALKGTVRPEQHLVMRMHPASEAWVLWNSAKCQSWYSLTVCTTLCCSFFDLVTAEHTVHAADTVCSVCVLASRCYMSSVAECVLQRKAVSCLNCAVCATLE